MKGKWLLWAALVLPLSCQGLFTAQEDGEGELRWSFSDLTIQNVTKAVVKELPDTNDFQLEVRSSDGEVIYTGPYGQSPESMLVRSGTYTVTAISAPFTAPKFDAPQWGDSKTVLVEAGGGATAVLECHQMNAGIRLAIHSNFLTVYPRAALFVRSEAGKLLYSYSEKRIAYFPPGEVSVVMSNEGKDETLLTRRLGERQMLTVGIDAPEGGEEMRSGPRLTITVDTTRIWNYEEYVIGDPDDGGETVQKERGSDLDSALGIGEARSGGVKSGVWVYGYIVGGDLTSSATGISFKGPFTSATNIALAARSSVTDKASCLSVNLPKGKIRDAVNLVDHPDLIGTRIYLKGDIVEAYYGIPGLKNVTDYAMK